MHDRRTRCCRATALAIPKQGVGWARYFSLSLFRDTLHARATHIRCSCLPFPTLGRLSADMTLALAHVSYSLTVFLRASLLSLSLRKRREGGWRAGICSASLLACLLARVQAGDLRAERALRKGERMWCISFLLLRGQIALCSIAGTICSLIQRRFEDFLCTV